ncbi:3-oxoacid CoA-transferase subunit B, partial [Geodermatophilus sabuli]
TGRACVNRVITDLAVIDVTADGFTLRETAPGVTPQEVADNTGAPLTIPADVGEMQLPAAVA